MRIQLILVLEIGGVFWPYANGVYRGNLGFANCGGLCRSNRSPVSALLRARPPQRFRARRLLSLPGAPSGANRRSRANSGQDHPPADEKGRFCRHPPGCFSPAPPRWPLRRAYGEHRREPPRPLRFMEVFQYSEVLPRRPRTLSTIRDLRATRGR